MSGRPISPTWATNDSTEPLDTSPQWRVLVVEDEDDVRVEIHDFLHGETVAGRPLSVSVLTDFDDALEEVRQRRTDLLILDVFRGKVSDEADEAGLRVLDKMKETGFVCAILFTAHPERVDDRRSHFVRVVGKEAGALERLRVEIESLFGLMVPQIYRAIVTHLDETLRDYMWKCVERRWNELAPIAGNPELLRVVLQRLAATLSTEGIERITHLAFGGGAKASPAPDTVHPAECYIMPPIAHQGAQLGDVRVRQSANGVDYLVILWPSCDMVQTATRTPKTDRIHCAVAGRLDATTEVGAWRNDPSINKTKEVERLIRNNRAGGPDRYHSIPGLLDIPDLLVDFQRSEVLPLEDVRAMVCRATLASPFAESLASRYVRYLGRLGTPDVDTNAVMSRLKDGWNGS